MDKSRVTALFYWLEGLSFATAYILYGLYGVSIFSDAWPINPALDEQLAWRISLSDNNDDDAFFGNRRTYFAGVSLCFLWRRKAHRVLINLFHRPPRLCCLFCFCIFCTTRTYSLALRNDADADSACAWVLWGHADVSRQMWACYKWGFHGNLLHTYKYIYVLYIAALSGCTDIKTRHTQHARDPNWLLLFAELMHNTGNRSFRCNDLWVLVGDMRSTVHGVSSRVGRREIRDTGVIMLRTRRCTSMVSTYTTRHYA